MKKIFFLLLLLPFLGISQTGKYYLPLFTSNSGSLGNSHLYDSGGITYGYNPILSLAPGGPSFQSSYNGGGYNWSYWTNFYDYTLMAANANPITGVYANTGKAAMQFRLTAAANQGLAQIYGTNTNNGAQNLLWQLDGAGNIKMPSYLNTRNDGSTSIALYTDANGNLKQGPVTGGSGGNQNLDQVLSVGNTTNRSAYFGVGTVQAQHFQGGNAPPTFQAANPGISATIIGCDAHFEIQLTVTSAFPGGTVGYLYFTSAYSSQPFYVCSPKDINTVYNLQTTTNGMFIVGGATTTSLTCAGTMKPGTYYFEVVGGN